MRAGGRAQLGHFSARQACGAGRSRDVAQISRQRASRQPPQIQLPTAGPVLGLAGSAPVSLAGRETIPVEGWDVNLLGTWLLTLHHICRRRGGQHLPPCVHLVWGCGGAHWLWAMGLGLGQPREDRHSPPMPARGQRLGDGQAQAHEEFLTASSGNLRLCSFCGFFFFFPPLLFIAGWPGLGSLP